MTLANAALAMAAWYGNTQTVVALLDAGANIERKDSDGCTALIIAARNGHVDTVKVLIERGATVNAKCHINSTPLLGACTFGHLEVVQLLLSKGANARACRGNNVSSLHLAVRCRDGESQTKKSDRRKIVERLLEEGVDVNVRGATTPLMEAAHRGDQHIVDVLLAHGADIGAKDADGNDIFYWAERNSDEEVFTLLQEVRDRQATA
jgi:ankyrin repeat protein